MAIRTIKAKGDGITNEATGDGAITPGHLVEVDSGGLVQVHASAGQNAERAFALEDDLQGNDLTDDYSDGNRVLYGVFKSGDEVNAILADGQSVVIGDPLDSNGNGELKKHSADSAGAVEYPEAIVAVAMEAVDASDSAATAVASRRLRVRII